MTVALPADQGGAVEEDIRRRGWLAWQLKARDRTVFDEIEGHSGGGDVPSDWEV